jgi:hypothetical protein
MGSDSLAVNGYVLWGYVVELPDGLRVQFALDDWLKVGPGIGRGFRSGCRARRTRGCTRPTPPNCRR